MNKRLQFVIVAIGLLAIFSLTAKAMECSEAAEILWNQPLHVPRPTTLKACGNSPITRLKNLVRSRDWQIMMPQIDPKGKKFLQFAKLH